MMGSQKPRRSRDMGVEFQLQVEFVVFFNKHCLRFCALRDLGSNRQDRQPVFHMCSLITLGGLEPCLVRRLLEGNS